MESISNNASKIQEDTTTLRSSIESIKQDCLDKITQYQDALNYLENLYLLLLHQTDSDDKTLFKKRHHGE